MQECENDVFQNQKIHRRVDDRMLEVEKKTMEEANADRIASIDRNGITYWIGFG